MVVEHGKGIFSYIIFSFFKGGEGKMCDTFVTIIDGFVY